MSDPQPATLGERAPVAATERPAVTPAPTQSAAPKASPAALEADRPAPMSPARAPATSGQTVPPPPETATVAPMRPDEAAPAAEAESGPLANGIGVLIVNLGTPDAANARAVSRYLKEFLSDPRVIENDGLLWKLVLNGVILPIRSRRKAHDYRRIWNREANESPIKTITRSQAERLAAMIEPLGKNVVVDWAMRYANPSISSRLERLIARGCDRILIVPLYPQYSATTTATVNDEVFRYLQRLRRQPALRIMPAYYDDPYYIAALTSSLQAQLKALPFAPDVIMLSYHGMPKEYVLKGDPYESQCERTTELLRARLGLDSTQLIMTFQSRFGRARWLEPYTIDAVKALAKGGVKNLVVMTPGFSADCLETLEEIAVENARVFRRRGGTNFAAISCLNDSETGMLMIRQLALRELEGWL